MQKAVALAFLVGILGSPGLLAQERSQPPSETPAVSDARRLSQTPMLRKTIERDARRLKPSLRSADSLPWQQPAPRGRSWIGRHPALFGALVGAGAGAASSAGRWTELYCATGGDEDCFFHGGAGVLFGAGMGAGIGALIGYIAGR